MLAINTNASNSWGLKFLEGPILEHRAGHLEYKMKRCQPCLGSITRQPRVFCERRDLLPPCPVRKCWGGFPISDESPIRFVWESVGARHDVSTPALSGRTLSLGLVVITCPFPQLLLQKIESRRGAPAVVAMETCSLYSCAAWAELAAGKTETRPGRLLSSPLGKENRSSSSAHPAQSCPLKTGRGISHFSLPSGKVSFFKRDQNLAEAMSSVHKATSYNKEPAIYAFLKGMAFCPCSVGQFSSSPPAGNRNGKLWPSTPTHTHTPASYAVTGRNSTGAAFYSKDWKRGACWICPWHLLKRVDVSPRGGGEVPVDWLYCPDSSVAVDALNLACVDVYWHLLAFCSLGDQIAGMLAVSVASSRTLEVLDLEGTGLTNQSALVRKAGPFAAFISFSRLGRLAQYLTHNLF